jgi:hypothetical protein
VVTVALGEKYVSLLPQWAESVSALERKPDQITIVGDVLPSKIKVRLEELLGEGGFYWEKFKIKPKNHAQVLLNQAIEATDAEWICKLDVDDIIYPHALNYLDDCDADIYCFGVTWQGHQVKAKPATRIDILSSQYNLVHPCSPFKKWVWEKAPFRDMIFEDWIFWIEAAHNGAKFVQSEHIDYFYDMKPEGAYQSADQAASELGVLAVKRELGIV